MYYMTLDSTQCYTWQYNMHLHVEAKLHVETKLHGRESSYGTPSMHRRTQNTMQKRRCREDKIDDAIVIQKASSALVG